MGWIQMDEREETREEETFALELDRIVVEKNLSKLGQNPFTLTHAFTQLIVTKASIESIDILREFPYLQYVDLSYNAIADLSPLKFLPHLLTLNASHNQITSVLDYQTPVCNETKRWDHGAGWIGSTLLRVDLSHNQITSMKRKKNLHNINNNINYNINTNIIMNKNINNNINKKEDKIKESYWNSTPDVYDDTLAHHSFLTELILDHNRITSIEGLTSLKHLKYLSLSHNRLKNTRGIPSNSAISTLILNHNEIESIESIQHLPFLFKLDVSYNEIVSLRGFEGCTKLQELDLSYNRLTNVLEVDHLTSLHHLVKLNFTGCPFSYAPWYRFRVLFQLQQVISLDGSLASVKERIQAKNAHGFDIQARQKVFHKYLPNEEFINLLPPLMHEQDHSNFHLLTAKDKAKRMVQRIFQVACTKVATKRFTDHVWTSMQQEQPHLFHSN